MNTMKQCLRCGNVCTEPAIFCEGCQSSLLDYSEQKSFQTVPMPCVEIQFLPSSKMMHKDDIDSRPLSLRPLPSVRRRAEIRRRRRICIVLALFVIIALIVDGILVTLVFMHSSHKVIRGEAFPLLTSTPGVAYLDQVVQLHISPFTFLSYVFLSYDVRETLRVDVPSPQIKIGAPGNIIERVSTSMSNEFQPDSTQRLEQIISTIFACRSVIKYNSVLSGEQKNELIADIDTSLRSLRTGFTRDASAQTIQPSPQFQQAGRMMSVPMVEKTHNDKQAHAALQELYRIYHAYIDTRQSNNISTFVVRFDTVISALNEVQCLLNNCQNAFVSPTEDLLHSIRTFIADLYYMFMELVRTLSKVLEGNDVHIDTEKLSSPDQRHLTSAEIVNQSVASLSDTFLEHQRLNKMKGTLSRRVSDSKAFLIFMRESLDENSHKRNEILAHLSNVALLLEDLVCVISSYEHAVGLLLGRWEG